jgi:hypothetical protein
MNIIIVLAYCIPFRCNAEQIWDSSVGIATKLRAGRPGLDSRQGQEIFLYITASKPALGPTQPPIQWVQGVKLLGHEADLSPPSSAEDKNGENVAPLPHTSSWSGT